MSIAIVIPSFNRPELLIGCLRKIFLSDVMPDEIIICDDNSGTENFVALRESGFLCKIRYFQNESRLGIDSNIKKCFDVSDSEYIWCIGEDDHILPSAVRNITSLIKNSHPSAIIVNYRYCSDDYMADIGPPIFQDFMLSRTALIRNFHKFGFVGSCIIAKRAWSKYSSISPVGTYFHHVCVLGRIFFLEDPRNIAFQRDVCVRNRAESAETASWNKKSIEVHLGYYKALESFSECLSDGEVRMLKKCSSVLFRPYSILWLVSKRGHGAYNTNLYQKYYSREPAPRRFLYLWISVLPPGIGKLIRRFFLEARKKYLNVKKLAGF